MEEPMAEPLTFGVWLRQRRKALELTQEALAEQCSWVASGCGEGGWCVERRRSGPQRLR
jgi:hypothetical protein